MTINGSGGTFDITLSMLSRNIKSNSFNIADTQYYKDALEVSAVSFDESTKTITITNKNGDTIKASATDAYNAGWAYAQTKFTRSGNTVYGPAVTVGGVSSYNASVGGSHWVTNKTSFTIGEDDVGSTAYSGIGYVSSNHYVSWT